MVRHRASEVPAEQVVPSSVLGVAGTGNDLVALHLALTGGALFALPTCCGKSSRRAADAALGVGLGAGGGSLQVPARRVLR